MYNSDVTVRLNTASAEEDQCLLRHHCLFSPAHWFTHVAFERGERTGLHRNQTIKMALKTTIYGAVPSCGKHCLCRAFLLIPKLGKNEWSLFWMKIHSRTRQLELDLLFTSFTADLFRKKAQFNVGFSEILKQKDDCANYIGSDSNVAAHTFNLNHSSVHLWRM